MIFEALLMVLVGTVQIILTPLPNIPAVGSTVAEAGDWVVTTLGGVMGLLNIIYTPTLLTAMFAMVLGVFAFERIYRVVLWLLKKIPLINIK